MVRCLKHLKYILQPYFIRIIQMHEKTVTVRNKAGIHCRPSSTIMIAAEQYPGHEFLVVTERGNSTLQSILDLLALGLQQGDQVTVKVTGPKETEACEKLAGLFATEFDFV